MSEEMQRELSDLTLNDPYQRMLDLFFDGDPRRAEAASEKELRRAQEAVYGKHPVPTVPQK